MSSPKGNHKKLAWSCMHVTATALWLVVLCYTLWVNRFCSAISMSSNWLFTHGALDHGHASMTNTACRTLVQHASCMWQETCELTSWPSIFGMSVTQTVYVMPQLACQSCSFDDQASILTIIV